MQDASQQTKPPCALIFLFILLFLEQSSSKYVLGLVFIALFFYFIMTGNSSKAEIFLVFIFVGQILNSYKAFPSHRFVSKHNLQKLFAVKIEH